MRLIALLGMPALLLLALPAAAAPVPAPYVRWIDRIGDVHDESLAAVIEESPARIEVRPLGGGEQRTIEMARVLLLVRERKERREERELFDARFDVAAGLRLDQARPILDRLQSKGSAPWIRMYASASRALLAEAAREPGALDRLERFLKEHPRSHFVSEVHRAVARERARRSGDDVEKSMAFFKEAYQTIARAGGPFLQRYAVLADGAARMAELKPGEPDVYLSRAAAGMFEKLDGSKDFGEFLVARSCQNWARLAYQRAAGRKIVAAGRPPRGALAEVGGLIEESALFLPELRSDLYREHAVLLGRCGRPKPAVAAARKALELAPGPARKRAARAALEALGK